MNNHSDSDLALTKRELQILELIAQGYSAKEVALEIKIAPRTVEGHIDTIRLKLRARNRTHMVAKAIAAHMLSADGRRERRQESLRGESVLFVPLGEMEPDLFERSIAASTGQTRHNGVRIS